MGRIPGLVAAAALLAGLLASAPVAVTMPTQAAGAASTQSVSGFPPPDSWISAQIPRPADQSGDHVLYGQGAALQMGVDPSGNVFAVVFTGADTGDEGYLNVFQLDEATQSWDLAYTFDKHTAGDDSSNWFGAALAWDGNLLAIGDPNGGGDDPLGMDDWCSALVEYGNCPGAVSLWQIGATAGDWSYQSTMKAPTGHNNMGSSVALSGGLLATGAPGRDFDGTGNPEFVAIYDVSSPASPTNEGVLKAEFEFGKDNNAALGKTVAIADNPNGSVVFWGTQQQVCSAIEGEGSWTRNGCYTPATDWADDTFGDALVWSPTTGQLLVGIPDNSTKGSGGTDLPGEVLPLVPPSGDPTANLSTWNAGTSVTPPNGETAKGTYFGAALAVDPATGLLLVGQSEEGLSGSGTFGNVYSFAYQNGGWAANGEFLPPADQQSDRAQYGATVSAALGPSGVLAVGAGAPAQAEADDNYHFGYAYLFTSVGNATLGLSIEQTDPPAGIPVAPQHEVTYTATLTNPGQVPAVETIFNIPTYVGLEIDHITEASGTFSCGFSPTCTAAALVAPGATIQFEVVMVAAPESKGQRFGLEAVASWSNPSYGAVTATTMTVVEGTAQAALDVSLSPAGASVVAPGTDAVYEITVTNTSSDVWMAQPQVGAGRCADEIGCDGDLGGPATLEPVSPVNQDWQCGTGSGVLVGPFLSCATVLLPPGHSQSFMLSLPVPATAPLGSTFDFVVAALWQNGNTPKGQDDVAVAVSTTVGQAVVVASETSTASTPAGSTLGLSFPVTNISTAATDGLVLSVITSLPESLISALDLSLSVPGFTCGVAQSNGVPYCESDAPFAPGAQVIGDLSAVVPSDWFQLGGGDGPYLLGVQAGWPGALVGTEFLPAANTTMYVTQDADISVVGTLKEARAHPGGRATVHVHGRNAGPSNAGMTEYRLAAPSGLALRSVTLPDGTTVDPADPDPDVPEGWTCGHEGAGYRCHAPSLADGGEHHLIAVFDVAGGTAGSTHTVTVSAIPTATDPDPSNNTATVEVEVEGTGVVEVGEATPTGGRSATAARTGSRLLPVTGSGLIGLLVALGLAMLAVGGTLSVARRRHA